MPYRLNVVYRRFQPTTSNNEQCRLAAEGKKRKNRFDDQSKQEKKSSTNLTHLSLFRRRRRLGRKHFSSSSPSLSLVFVLLREVKMQSRATGEGQIRSGNFNKWKFRLVLFSSFFFR
jgi:hypothetical protein